MKKLLSLTMLTATMLFTLPSNAQLKFGLKGGLNITDMSFSKDVINASNRTGFFIGPTIKVKIPIVGLGVDASALYDQRSAEINDVEDINSTSKQTIKQHSLNIPINLRYDIGLGDLAGIYFAAGPQFGFNLGDDVKEIYNNAAQWKLKKSTFSVNLGLGVMLINHLQVGANYNIVCGKTGEVTVLDGAESLVRGRANSWQISAAYYF